jgi:hypothetical protein
MAFVKLDCGILNSTLWFERDARTVFITALLMAEPFELREPQPQISVNSLEHTGWIVPPGWYGFVPAAGVGIIHRSGVDELAGREALELLGSPEASSRSSEFDGRRLVRIDGGYIVLNFIKYRERDATTAERSRRWRERKRSKHNEPPTPVSGVASRVIRHQAEAEAEVPKSGAADVEADNLQWFLDSWPVWYAEARHGARYLLRPAIDGPFAQMAIRGWPDRTHLERMSKFYLRLADRELPGAHQNRNIQTFVEKYASACDAEVRKGWVA